jgi:hypothetical protein
MSEVPSNKADRPKTAGVPEPKGNPRSGAGHANSQHAYAPQTKGGPKALGYILLFGFRGLAVIIALYVLYTYFFPPSRSYSILHPIPQDPTHHIQIQRMADVEVNKFLLKYEKVKASKTQELDAEVLYDEVNMLWGKYDMTTWRVKLDEVRNELRAILVSRSRKSEGIQKQVEMAQ